MTDTPINTQGNLGFQVDLALGTERPPACDVSMATYLDGIEHSGVVLGQNCFVGPVRACSDNVDTTDAVPAQAVFLICTGGAAPVNAKGCTEMESFLTVMVRSNANDYEGGWSFARHLWALIHKHPPDASFYLCECSNSEPIYQAPDGANRHLWVINARLRRTE